MLPYILAFTSHVPGVCSESLDGSEHSMLFRSATGFSVSSPFCLCFEPLRVGYMHVDRDLVR